MILACNKLYPLSPDTVHCSIFSTVMGKLNHSESGNSAAALKTDGNPEGKGLNGLLLDWVQTEPSGVVAKSWHQLLAEFFTSMLVLSAAFKFRPAVGASYYLYWINGEWSLSLIAPDEWSHERRAGFAATCALQRDMTWTIDPSDLLAEDNTVSAAMGRFYDAFAVTLDTDRTLEEILPFYVGSLPYFQRLHANALSRSMRATMRRGNQEAISCKHWFALLPQLNNGLLACKD